MREQSCVKQVAATHLDALHDADDTYDFTLIASELDIVGAVVGDVLEYGEYVARLTHFTYSLDNYLGGLASKKFYVI